MDNRARKIQTRSNPSDAGTKHLEREGLEAGKSRVKIEGDIAAALERQKLAADGIDVDSGLATGLIENARQNAEAKQKEVEAIDAYNEAQAEAERAASKTAAAGKKDTERRQKALGIIREQLVALQRETELLGMSCRVESNVHLYKTNLSMRMFKSFTIMFGVMRWKN